MEAIIKRDIRGVHRIFIKRGKYKHWFELGRHTASNNAFYRALKEGSISWKDEIEDVPSIFKNGR